MWIPRHRDIPTKHEEWMALFIDNDHDDDPVMAQARPSCHFPSLDIEFWTNSSILVSFEQILVYWSNVDSPPSRHPNEARGMNGSFHRQWSRWRSGYGPSPAKPVQARPGSLLLPALLPTPAKIGQQFSLLVPFRCTFTLPLCLYPEFQSWDENFEIVSYCKNFPYKDVWNSI